MRKENIRLIHLVKSLKIGGIEKSTITYSNELVDKIDFVGIFGCKGEFDNSNLLKQKVKRFIPEHCPQNKFYFLKTLKFLIRVIKKNSITHIHYHQRIFIPYILLIKVFCRKVKIIYTHHNFFNDKINYLIYADSIIALNSATKKDIPFFLQKKVRIIPHGIQINHRYSAKKFPPQNIGYVGRFVKEKGLLILLDAFYSIANKIPEIKLLLIGDGELKSTILEYIIKRKLSDKVILIPPQMNEDSIYDKIDILVLPSNKLEGFGLVLLEAMSRKIPVIVSDFPPLKNFIQDEINGLVFANNLEEKLISIVTNPTLYSTLVENGYSTVKEKNDLCKIINYYLDLYQTL